MRRPSREKGESATRQGVDILGKSQMEGVGSAAAARAETESSGRTNRPFQPRRDHSNCSYNLNSKCSQSSRGVDTTQGVSRPPTHSRKQQRCCMDLRIPSFSVIGSAVATPPPKTQTPSRKDRKGGCRYPRG